MNYSVLVLGCKKHSEIAVRFFQLENIHWPEATKVTCFCTDEKDELTSACIENIVAGADPSYKSRIVEGLKTIQTDYVFVLLDDYYITKRMDNDKIESLVEDLKTNNVEYCRLVGIPRCHSKYKFINGTFKIAKDKHYGVNLQPSIWKTESILNFLSLSVSGNAWEVECSFFEFQKEHHEQCITFNRNFLNYKNGVLRGKLFPYTNKILKKNNLVSLDMPRISLAAYLSYNVKVMISHATPSFLRKSVKKIGRKCGKKYYSND